MLLEHEEIAPLYLSGIGTEIGAFTTPIPGIRPIYVDRFAEYAGCPTLAEYYGDGADLPFTDSSLDYVASSHVLEHIANPVQALREWYRVLKHRGVIYCVIPHRAKTFDRSRALTTPAHMWEDYVQEVIPVDGTHIQEFSFGIDLALFEPERHPSTHLQRREELCASYTAAVRAGKEINIHFHTFEPASFLELLKLCNARRAWPGEIRLCELHDCFPRHHQIGFLVVARVFKTWRERIVGIRRNRLLKDSAVKVGT